MRPKVRCRTRRTTNRSDRAHVAPHWPWPRRLQGRDRLHRVQVMLATTGSLDLTVMIASWAEMVTTA